MITALTLTSGALYAGASAYETLTRRRRARTFLTDGHATPKLPKRGQSWLDNVRRQQLDVMSTNSDDSDGQAVERMLNRNLAVSSASMGLVTVGGLILPPLGLLSALPAAFVAAPIFKDTYNALVNERRVSATVLDAIAITIGISTAHYFAFSLFIFLYYVRRKMLMKTEDHSRQSLMNVFGQLPRTVWVEQDGIEIERPIETVQAGDIVVVDTGSVIPVDGTIASGMATIDQHMLTGESQPVEKGVGDQVFASTLMLGGRVRIQAERAGDETMVANIGDILRHTADFKTSIQSRGERLGDQMAAPFLGLGALAFPLVGPVGAGAVLLASFGYQMRLLAPLGMLNFLNLASQQGILIKDGRSLELLREVDTIVFDKTGALTLEQPHVGAIEACHGYCEDDVLRYAAAAEARQPHPIAKAILQEAETRGVVPPPIDDAQYEVGYGIKVRIGQQVVRVGSARFMEVEGIDKPDRIRDLQTEGHTQGHSIVYVAIDDHLAGTIALYPTLRPEAKSVISELRKRNMSMVIISGDHEIPTSHLAHELGIDHYFAETLPEEKADLIDQLQQQGRSVCYVGDGINDAIALKKAKASISLRGASTAATDSAQIILMDQSLHQLCRAFDIAQEFDTTMNFSFAMTMVPGIMILGGVFFLHFGLVAPMILNNLGMAVGAGNSMLPLLKSDKATSDHV
ncbi:heavy metal translocating P-type ATPase [Candidatus Entotheonella palauensis]|uniref:heavy metal translocating P-type ATPase n=1 Tax=Candidatus Entotheonella palauensis TaxID=93172 RepID=UPI000B7E68A4|nr:heavy metal translocating P-type ATPase [Candidatus Entotheonella palauensis]